jgi:hypothetical protein
MTPPISVKWEGVGKNGRQRKEEGNWKWKDRDEGGKVRDKGRDGDPCPFLRIKHCL